MPSRCSTPSAVLALPWGSRSITRTCSPWSASAAAMFTAVVVLPTPPFWLAIVKTRWRSGRGSPLLAAVCSRRTARSASAPIGVSTAGGSGHASAGGGPPSHVSRETSGWFVSRETSRWVGAAAAPGTPGAELTPASRPSIGARPDSVDAPRRRSRGDPRRPRSISSPSHRRPRGTPAHAGAHGPPLRHALP